jgi:hypothetical protein
VLDAVTTILERAREPLRVRDVQAAIEEVLGGPVPFSSVNEALSTHAQGDSARFHRVLYGVYEHRIVAGARGPRECGLTSSDDEGDRPEQSGNEGGESLSTAMPGFESDIKPLFNERDRGSMLSHFDLWSLADVSQNADAILQAVSTGSMPCYGQWPSEQVDLLRRWVEGGKPA